MLDDLRHAARTLRQSPGFTAVAVLTLALGIGANTAIWSVVQAVLLTPLPFADPDRLVRVTETARGEGFSQLSTSYPDFLDFRAAARSFSGLAAWSRKAFTVTGREGGTEAERLPGELVSASYFPLLGVRAALGRTFRPEEDETPDARPVVVLCHDLWQRRFAGSPAALGSVLPVNGRGFTVVGVLPRGFRGLADDSELFVPMAMMSIAMPAGHRIDRGSRWHEMVARLAPGKTLGEARAELDALAVRLATAHPNTNAGHGVFVVPLQEDRVGGFRPLLLSLLGAVGFVLLIACVNVANLLLARAAARRRETAIRAALGAGRGRLARQAFAESLLLGALGGLSGLLVALWTIDLLTAWSPLDLPSFVHAGLGAPVLAFTSGIVLVSGLLAGLAPALQVASPDLHAGLKETGRGGIGGIPGSRSDRWRRLLVVGQVALALLLVAGAGLMVQSFLYLQRIDPGFRAERLLTLRVALPAGQDRGAPAWALAERLLARAGALPGVSAAALSDDLPLEGRTSSTLIQAEGREAEKSYRGDWTYTHSVSPGFFRALGAGRLAGRDLAATDTATAPPVAVVSRSFAARAWPGLDPRGSLGRRVHLGNRKNPWITVVGVVEEVRHRRLVSDAERFPDNPDLYFPLSQRPEGDLGLLVRTAAAPASLAAALRHEVAAVDRGIPLYDLTPMSERLAAQSASSRWSALLMGAFGALALLLAGLGVYGVLSCAVAQRGHEIGVRMALGARRALVLRLVLVQVARLAAAGLALGLAGTLALTRLLASQLYGLSATDPATLAAATLLLAGATFAAGWLPAQRAARVDPLVALRME